MNPTQQAMASPVDDAPRAPSIGEIVVFVDGQTDPRGIMEFAGLLAQEYDAHLTGAFMRPAPARTPPARPPALPASGSRSSSPPDGRSSSPRHAARHPGSAAS